MTWLIQQQIILGMLSAHDPGWMYTTISDYRTGTQTANQQSTTTFNSTIAVPTTAVSSTTTWYVNSAMSYLHLTLFPFFATEHSSWVHPCDSRARISSVFLLVSWGPSTPLQEAMLTSKSAKLDGSIADDLHSAWKSSNHIWWPTCHRGSYRDLDRKRVIFIPSNERSSHCRYHCINHRYELSAPRACRNAFPGYDHLPSGRLRWKPRCSMQKRCTRVWYPARSVRRDLPRQN